MNKIIFSCLFFVSLVTYANDIKADSLQINALFNDALQNPNQSDSLHQEAKKIVNASNNNLILNDTYHYNLAKFLFQTAQLDSAITIAEMGLKIHQPSQKPAYKSFKFHNILGSVYVYKNKHKKAVTQFQIAIKILEDYGNYHQSALIKNNMANVFFSLHDYESSYKYSQQAYETLKAENDTVYLPSLTGIFAVSAIKLKHFSEGDSLANESLELSKKYNNILGLIVSNYSLGDVSIGQDKYSEAEAYFLTSLQISESVGHLHFVTLNKVGLLYTYINLEDFKQAVKYGEEALEETISQKNENTLYGIHKNLGYAYAGLKNYEKAYLHIEKAHNLYQNNATLDNKMAINDILIKYDTEKKEKEIAENKLTIAQDEIQLSERKFWIMTLGSILFILVLSYIFYVRFQQQKLIRIQKEEEQKRTLALIKGEEKERERISNELHDGVASSLTAVKIKLEHIQSQNENPDITQLIDQLTNLHEETRRISHNLMSLSLENSNLIEAVQNFCAENSTPDLNIKFINLISQKLNFDTQTTQILYRIIQELVNNVKKHAHSKICYVQLAVSDNELNIMIEDEGVGFDATQVTTSQGLNSIHKRVGDLNGDCEFDCRIGRGTVVMINIPLD